MPCQAGGDALSGLTHDSEAEEGAHGRLNHPLTHPRLPSHLLILPARLLLSSFPGKEWLGTVQGMFPPEPALRAWQRPEDESGKPQKPAAAERAEQTAGEAGEGARQPVSSF